MTKTTATATPAATEPTPAEEPTREQLLEALLEARAELEALQVKHAPKPKAVQISGSQLKALLKLGNTEHGTMTRAALHADPMVVIALVKRGWAIADRSGDDRAADLIQITQAGRDAAAS